MPRVRRRFGSIDNELIPVASGKPSNEDLIGVRFSSSKLVVKMRDTQTEIIFFRQFGEEVKENYRVHSAAHRNDYLITFTEERFLSAITLESI
jgi:hypothetical protein